MNTENILKLADYIEKELVQLPYSYDYNQYEPVEGQNSYFFMNDYLFDVKNRKKEICGTAGCIAGSVLMMKGKARTYIDNDSNLEEEAAEFLGLTEDYAAQLFTPRQFICTAKGNSYQAGYQCADIRQDHAVFVLRELVKCQKYLNRETIPALWRKSFETLGEGYD